jgi:hypothetical protein
MSHLFEGESSGGHPQYPRQREISLWDLFTHVVQASCLHVQAGRLYYGV